MSEHSVDRLIAEARQHLDAADERQRSADDEKWAAAELLWRANKEHGVSQREIAERVGRSVFTVNRHIAVWEIGRVSAHKQRPTFTEAYYEVRGPEGSRQGIADREVRKAARERPEAIAEAIKQAPPEMQRKIADAIVKTNPEPSLRDAVSPPKPPAPTSPSAARMLGRAIFTIWEVSQLLLDEVPTGEEKVWLAGDVERGQRLLRGIAWLLDTGEIDQAFSELLEEVAADR